MFQVIGLDAQLLGMGTRANENPNRILATRPRHDRQLRTGYLFDVGLQFARSKLLHPRRFLGDDDFRTRPTVLNEEGLGVSG
jgi:hypothetical protein